MRFGKTAPLTAALLVSVALLLSVPAPQAAPGGIPGPPTTHTVELNCQPGWRASAAGQYGGVAFGIACNNGKARVQIEDTGATDYSVRIGVESDTVAVDCFYSGDSATVSESCFSVMFRVH